MLQAAQTARKNGVQSLHELELWSKKLDELQKTDKGTRAAKDKASKLYDDLNEGLKMIIPGFRTAYEDQDRLGSLANLASSIKNKENEIATLTNRITELSEYKDLATKVDSLGNMIQEMKSTPSREVNLDDELKKIVKENLKDIVAETVKSVSATDKFKKSFADAVSGTQEKIKQAAEKSFTKTLKASLKESQGEVVAQTTARQEADLLEREKRARNIVIAGIPESKLTEIKDKIEADKKYIAEIAGIPVEKIEKCFRAGPPIGAGVNKDRTQPRPLIVIVETPELAKTLHRYGNGSRVLVGNKEYWINPDLTRAERRANYDARLKRKGRKTGREAEGATSASENLGSVATS